MLPLMGPSDKLPRPTWTRRGPPQPATCGPSPAIAALSTLPCSYTPEEIVRKIPHLTLAQVHAALRLLPCQL